ncbi:MAG: CcdB family protein [Beijerinckiaceae bacterium]
MQLDIYSNPVTRARAAFPYVSTLHSERAGAGATRIVAFMAPANAFGASPGRLLPLVSYSGVSYRLDLLTITNIPASTLTAPCGDLRAFRDDIVSALDWLFLGV